MSSLNLPPYVLEMIFDSLKLNSQHEDYQRRQGIDFLSIPRNDDPLQAIDDNFVHLLVEEKTHLENIRLFIAIQQFRNKVF